MKDISLSCNCGTVQGIAKEVTPSDGIHIVCYCDDCQRFAREIGNEAALDQYGGSEIFQLYPSKVKIEQGIDQLRCLQFSARGPVRWYTNCCNSPFGNAMPAGMPMIGINVGFMAADTDASVLGEVEFYVQGQCAKGKPPHQNLHPRFPLKLMFTSLYKALKGKLAGQGRPSPFYNADDQMISEPKIFY